MSDKLYVCLEDNGQISLQTRFDVDSVISNAEEFEGNMPFSVVGTVNVPVVVNPYLIVAKNGSAIIYDVIEANDEEAAKTTFLAKKRWANRQVSVKHVRDLNPTIKAYYE